MSQEMESSSKSPETAPQETTQESAQEQLDTKSASIRFNYSDESERLLNQLINLCFQTDYDCHSMWFYFQRSDICLGGVSEFHHLSAKCSYKWALKLMEYQVLRGGCVSLGDLKRPAKDCNWGTSLDSIQHVICHYKEIYKLVLCVYETGVKCKDYHLTHFLEEWIMDRLVIFIRKCGVLMCNMKKAGPSLGEYEFNKDLKLHLDDLFKEHLEKLLS